MSGDGMSTFIDALTSASSTTSITSANLWTEATAAAGLIAVVVLFAFGYNIVRKVTKGAAKGKVRF